MKYFISLLLLVTFISCTDDNSNDLKNLNQTEDDIIKYVDDNNLNAERTELGVYYIIDELGEGVKPTEDAYVTSTLKGYFLDGNVFEDTGSDDVKLDLLTLITGFKDGIQRFNEGSIGTLIIPPNLAFGDSGNGTIPGGAVMLFDVNLIEVDNPDTEADIIAYLDENELNATMSDSGLYYTIDEPGSGEEITPTSTVTVAYTGYFLDGTTFDEGSETGVQFDLENHNLIPGFKEGITYFKEGGKGTLLLPADLAYGEDGSANIPRNKVLIFDIEVKSLDL